MVEKWLLGTLVVLASLGFSTLVAFAIASRRDRAWVREGWLTDTMIKKIIHSGRLSGRDVPEQGLDLDEIAREEERFWSETWDEPENRWD